MDIHKPEQRICREGKGAHGRSWERSVWKTGGSRPTQLLFDVGDAPRGEGSGRSVSPGSRGEGSELFCVTGPEPPVPALLLANPLWPEVLTLPPNCHGGGMGAESLRLPSLKRLAFSLSSVEFRCAFPF